MKKILTLLFLFLFLVGCKNYKAKVVEVDTWYGLSLVYSNCVFSRGWDKGRGRILVLETTVDYICIPMDDIGYVYIEYDGHKLYTHNVFDYLQGGMDDDQGYKIRKKGK